MSNSSLATHTNISPYHSSPRNHAIDTITIHCFVGQVTAERGCEVFQSKAASCNYVVGYDGSVGLCVEEKDRSWCSSNAANDNRAVTIEVATESENPYKCTEAAYNALLDLVTDICKRNGIAELVWSTDKTARVNHMNGCNMTVHRDYANKACPGEYLYNRHGEIAEAVNKRLTATEDDEDMAVRYNTIDDVPDWAKAETQELIDAGALKGGDSGLNVTEDMLRCLIICKRYADGTHYSTVDELPDWAKADVQTLIDKGYLKGGDNGLDLSLDMVREMIVCGRMMGVL